MLEILLGTGAIMTITSYTAAEDLIDLSRKFLDKDTLAVIRYLLFATKSHIKLEEYCKKLTESPHMLSEAF